MPKSAKPVVLIAEFTAKLGNEEEIADLLAGLAEKVRREEGNVVFDCYRQAKNRAKFVVYEVYQDQPAFEAHIAADYGAVFNAKLQTLIVEPHSILTFLDPLKG